MLLQNVDSNWTMVVVIDETKPENCTLTWQELINKYFYFFHPVEKANWPKKPPNYIAFVFDNELSTIHHIENYEVFNDPNEVISIVPSQIWDTHYFYQLGKAIHPEQPVKIGNTTGKILWCMIDTLLTSKTVEEAYNITEERKRQAEY